MLDLEGIRIVLADMHLFVLHVPWDHNYGTDQSIVGEAVRNTAGEPALSNAGEVVRTGLVALSHNFAAHDEVVAGRDCPLHARGCNNFGSPCPIDVEQD